MGKTVRKNPWPVEFDTFHRMGDWEIVQLKSNEPTCFNGMVRIKRYKITIEEIPESIETYRERLQHLWDHCDSHHHWDPLKGYANFLGIELVGSPGSKRKK